MPAASLPSPTALRWFNEAAGAAAGRDRLPGAGEAVLGFFGRRK